MVLITWTRRPRPDGNGAIKVLLVDDHRMVRKGFRSIIEEQPDIRVVGEAANGIEAAEKTRIMRPVAVIMDINMPVMNGLEATRSIHREMSDVAVVGLSLHSQDDVFWRRRCLIL
jgi:YesN/AraC family two-component response regulator